jgi:hypothetical protein
LKATECLQAQITLPSLLHCKASPSLCDGSLRSEAQR